MNKDIHKRLEGVLASLDACGRFVEANITTSLEQELVAGLTDLCAATAGLAKALSGFQEIEVPLRIGQNREIVMLTIMTKLPEQPKTFAVVKD